MNEVRAVDTFIRSKLTADATITALVGTRVVTGTQRQTLTYPAVLFDLLSAQNTNALPRNERLLVRALYRIVAAHNSGDYAAVGQIADRIDAVLRSAFGNVVYNGVTYYVGSAENVEQIEQEQILGDTRYNLAGGHYRFIVHRLS